MDDKLFRGELEGIRGTYTDTKTAQDTRILVDHDHLSSPLVEERSEYVCGERVFCCRRLLTSPWGKLRGAGRGPGPQSR